MRQTEITDINTGQPGVLLDSNGVYMISVAYTGTQTGIFTCVDPAVDYTLSSDIYQQYISPSFNGTNWFPAGFELNMLLPFLQLLLRSTPVLRMYSATT